MSALRNASREYDPRERYSLYRLCECTACGGTGKASGFMDAIGGPKAPRCKDCRGEGRIREEVASCESPEAVGVALVTLGGEGEWDGCPFGLLDRLDRKWLVLPWLPSARNVHDAAVILAKSRKKSSQTP